MLLNAIRQVEKCSTSELEFPIILGRDFAGEVVAKGNSVSSELMVGDSVFGVTPPHRPGCHAQYVIAHKDWVSSLLISVLGTEDIMLCVYLG